MCTILISSKGKSVTITEKPSPYDDSFVYKIEETGFVTRSQEKAFLTAKKFLKKQKRIRTKFN